MYFIVTGTGPNSTIAFAEPTAADALARATEFQQAGLKDITIEDDEGRRVTLDDLATSSSGPGRKR